MACRYTLVPRNPQNVPTAFPQHSSSLSAHVLGLRPTPVFSSQPPLLHSCWPSSQLPIQAPSKQPTRAHAQVPSVEKPSKHRNDHIHVHRITYVVPRNSLLSM